MPRTSDWFLDCVIYVYGSQLAASENDERVGGSGFLAAVRLEQNPNHYSIYAVTAAHVIREAKTPFLRLNKRFVQGIEVIEASADAWMQHPDGDDVAVRPLQISTGRLRTLCLETERFVTKQLMGQEDIGIGDDVFMVGRFAQHSGGTAQNIPAIRFGNVAMMPQPIRRDNGILQESFLVECRSIPGYSGSPVFVYKREFQEHKQVNPFQIYSKGFWLLGVDWCHLRDVSQIVERRGEEKTATRYIAETNTGMAGVIPAWKILEVINSEDFVKHRQEEDKRITAERKRSPVSLDTLPASKRPFTKKDFESALKKVSRRIKPEQRGEEKK